MSKENYQQLKKAVTVAVATINLVNAFAPIAIPYSKMSQDIANKTNIEPKLKEVAYEVIAGGGQILDSLVFTKAEARSPEGSFTNPVTATVSGETVNSSAQNILEGGTAINTTISSGGIQNVSGGSVFETLLSGGIQNVSSAGRAEATTIYSGGIQNISSGGSADITTISSAGIQNVLNFGAAYDTTISSGGLQNIIRNDAVANFTTISGGGSQNIASGGSANDTTISSGGVQYVDTAGLATNTTISGGGVQNVFNQGSAINTTISSGGIQNVYSFGMASNTTISSGGIQNVSGGDARSATISSGGIQNIYSNGYADNTIISGGIQNISSSGYAIFTSVFSGGIQNISSGAYASGNNIFSGGIQTIYSGGTNSGINIIYSGGTAVLKNGARVHGFLENEGNLDVSDFSGNTIFALLTGSGGSVVFNQGTLPTYNKNINISKISAASQTFEVSADLKNNTADKITVTGNASGTHYIKVTKEASFGVKLKNLHGAATFAQVLGTDTSLFLGKESTIGGVKLLPNIVHNGNLWQIADYGIVGNSDLAKVAATNADMNYAVLYSGDQILRQRIGNLQDNLKDAGIWVKLSGGELAVDANSIKHATFQGGYDRVNTTKNGKTIIGMLLEHFDGSANYVDNGSGKLKNTRVGVYHTWLGNSGHYYDIALKTGRLHNQITVQDIDSTDKGSYNAWNTSLSMEYGYKKPLKNGMYITPFAKLSLGRINGATYTTDNGTPINQDAITSVVGKAGISIGQSTERSKWYLSTTLNHEFAAKSKTTTGEGIFAGTVEHSLKGTSLELALGTSVQVSKAGLLYADLSKSFGGKVVNKWQLQAGYRFNF